MKQYTLLIERRILRKDYATNDTYLFFYTDIGKSYSIYAIIYFNRGRDMPMVNLSKKTNQFLMRILIGEIISLLNI